MDTIFFSTHDFERPYLDHWTDHFNIKANFLELSLREETIDLVKNA